MSSFAGYPKTAVVTGYPNTAALTGYPASGSNGAPPPLPLFQPPAPSPPASAPRSRFKTFRIAFYVFAILFAIAVVAAILVAIITSVLDSRRPEFAVSSACVTGFNLSSTQQQQQQQLSASFDLNLTVHNPSRHTRIYYEQVTASVLYASDILSENSTLAPFDQGKGETTVVRVQLATIGRYVNSYVAKGIESDRGRGDGAVGFNVRLFSSVILSGATRWSALSVHCDDVLIGFGNGTNATTTGYLLGSKPNKCAVISDIQ